MDAHNFLKEIEKHPIIRDHNWQGPSARGGQQHQHQRAPPSHDHCHAAESQNTASLPTSSSLWTRLATATGSTTHGSAVVRLMQKHLLERVDNLALDEIELMARTTQ